MNTLHEAFLQEVAGHYAADPTTAGLTIAWLPGKGYYASVARYHGKFGRDKEVVAIGEGPTLEAVIEKLITTWRIIAGRVKEMEVIEEPRAEIENS